jgi:hypothetical protein
MTDREPVEVTNLDRYGSPPLPWSRAHDLLVASPAQPQVSRTSRPGRAGADDQRPGTAAGHVGVSGDHARTRRGPHPEHLLAGRPVRPTAGGGVFGLQGCPGDAQRGHPVRGRTLARYRQRRAPSAEQIAGEIADLTDRRRLPLRVPVGLRSERLFARLSPSLLGRVVRSPYKW